MSLNSDLEDRFRGDIDAPILLAYWARDGLMGVDHPKYLGYAVRCLNIFAIDHIRWGVIENNYLVDELVRLGKRIAEVYEGDHLEDFLETYVEEYRLKNCRRELPRGYNLDRMSTDLFRDAVLEALRKGFDLYKDEPPVTPGET